MFKVIFSFAEEALFLFFLTVICGISERSVKLFHKLFLLRSQLSRNINDNSDKLVAVTSAVKALDTAVLSLNTVPL